jgi:ABC-type proline/glycine betaine transport system substrate-binding protein
MADALKAASGRPVRYQQIDLAARSGDIAAMYRYLEQTGYQVNISELRRRFSEVAWTSFADWTQQRITVR